MIMCKQKLKPISDRIAAVIFATAMHFFILSFSISLPIYCRGFYFAHIEPLNLVEYSGYSVGEIKEAYNEVLDYLTLPNREFGCGVMPFSKDGEAHFADCKILFNINLTALITSSVCLVVLFVLKRFKRVKGFFIGRLPAYTYSGLAAILVPLVVGVLASLNFEKAFMVFHQIFFPGKSNWYFDSRVDKIINVLPEQFFMNCAILIGSVIALLSATLIVVGIVKRKRKN